MTLEEYKDLMCRQQKMFTPQMQDAIKRQNYLSEQVYAAREEWYALEDAFRENFAIGCKKLFTKYPDATSHLPNKDSVYENMISLMKSSINKEFSGLMDKLREIPELSECQTMDKAISAACFKFQYYSAQLNKQIAKDRKTFFSKEYLACMDKLANKGVFLYHLETPDYPLLDGDSEEFILDSMLFNECMSAKALLRNMVTMKNVGISMQRKQEDIYIAVELMANGFYRTAARNWFSLIESEHKKYAEAFNGFFEKKQKLKNGKQRSDKIFDLLFAFPMDWEQHAWMKIDSYYQNILKGVKGYPSRNAITHGDYSSEELDISAHDTMKLLLLYVNLRIIADHMCNLEEQYKNLITIMPTILDLLEKNILTLPKD